jgi:hypothetical protein
MPGCLSRSKASYEQIPDDQSGTLTENRFAQAGIAEHFPAPELHY